jgi:LytS/YehU family sensor histidine kinase
MLVLVAAGDLAIWILAGLFATSEFYRRAIVMGGTIVDWHDVLIVQMVTALNWAAFTPLVENSIVHGIRKLDDGGTVTVRASRSGDELRFEVRDTGPGCDPATPFARGHVGVAHTVARLDSLFGDAPWLRYRRDGGEFVAELRVPVRQS